MEDSEIERRHPLARCEDCDWYSKSDYVGSGGPTSSTLLVVGEAPGRMELEVGEPFVGPSGILLDKVLAHHDIDRTQIRFTNAVSCHPPFKAGGGVTPTKNVLDCCAPRLKAELEGKETVVALGNTAWKALSGGTTKITAARIGPPKVIDGVRYIPTIHPAACLRQADFFPSLVRDISKIKQRVTVEWEPPTWRAFDE